MCKWQDVLDACGYDKLSCSLESNIFAGGVIQSGQIHSLSTGIGTTSVTSTRDWLMQNILVATDDYSKEMSTNMTDILRAKYEIDDRVKKAWFINPGKFVPSCEKKRKHSCFVLTNCGVLVVNRSQVAKAIHWGSEPAAAQ